MFVRLKRNASGSTSVQILKKEKRRNILIKTVGCARKFEDIERLQKQAERELEILKPQLSIDFGISTRESVAVEMLKNISVRAVGPELVLGRIFDSLGFNQLGEELFKDIVLARLTYPSSKLKTVEYLLQHRKKVVHEDQIYRFLDRLSNKYKSQVEQLAYAHTKKVLGTQLNFVFYDMTTLYFEAEDEDDLRRIGFSKDGKFQHPQIMLGLLVGADGYPITYDIFEGNTFEGKTLLPVLEKAQEKFQLSNPIVIADSGLLSKQNIELLSTSGYKFIIGARLKTESKVLKAKILDITSDLKDNQRVAIEYNDGLKLIIDYSAKRARKDAKNREKGIVRLKQSLKSGKLTKNSINNRGYNKFLTLKGETLVSLNLDAIKQDSAWDGLKGYLTNSELNSDIVIANYRQLWKIEKAFRISKTDLRIRPIYHRKKQRIEAHICVAFVAYTVFKELERLLLCSNIRLSPQKVIELLKTIYQLELFLPDSNKILSQFASLSQEQILLLNLLAPG